MRKYSHHSPHEILTDVAIHGKSEGWQGTKEELKAWEAKLNKFNVFYVDDFIGTWMLCTPMIDRIITFSEEFPPASEGLASAINAHLEKIMAKKDAELSATFTIICDRYKTLLESVQNFFKNAKS